MRKKIAILSLFLLSILSFGKINDGLGILNDEEKVTLEEKISEISEKRGISIYVNSFSGDEGFVVEKAEKLIILNLIKPDEDTLKVELKLTKDMELDDIQDNIDNILVANESYLKDKKFLNYITETLNGLDGVLENVKIEEPIVVEEEIVQEKKNGFFIEMGIAFFVIFAIILRVLMLKYRKSLKEEIDIISRKR
jgi:hypothetical protein